MDINQSIVNLRILQIPHHHLALALVEAEECIKRAKNLEAHVHKFNTINNYYSIKQ
jgi:hypothetical protein